MVEMLDRFERDCDQSIYGELSNNCVAHREDSHLRFMDAWSCTCGVCELSSYKQPPSGHQFMDGR